MESSSQLPTGPESNRNYYNTTTNQEYNNPSKYNTYFSVYDEETEDGDLYRDGNSFLYSSSMDFDFVQIRASFLNSFRFLSSKTEKCILFILNAF